MVFGFGVVESILSPMRSVLSVDVLSFCVFISALPYMLIIR